VRGFTGFGAALIFMPLASTVLDPKLAAAALLVVDDVLTLPMAFAALRFCHWRTVLPAAIAAMATAPVGAWVLAHGDAITLRWTISAIVLAMLALILSGIRYHGNPRTEASAAVGAVAGLLGGVSQVSGPPVIAFWMSGPLPLAIVRANLLVFFALASFSSFAAYLWHGFFTADALWLMLLVTPAFAVALFAGARLFRISQGAAYRPVAYAVIALAAVTSMPVFDGVLRRPQRPSLSAPVASDTPATASTIPMTVMTDGTSPSSGIARTAAIAGGKAASSAARDEPRMRTAAP
jgi:uncharacterized membrane protein YfcA